MKTPHHHELNSDQAERIVRIKAAEGAFLDVLRELKPGRETALAVTNVEQAAMWAIRGAVQS